MRHPSGKTRLPAALIGLALVLGPLSAAPALADPHHGWARGAERGPERGPERGERGGWRGVERSPPPWSHGRAEGWRREAAPPPGYYAPPREYVPRRPYGVRRGGYLPPDVSGPVIEDYGRYRLRPPPPGYTWVRVGNAFLLMNMASGQIFDVIPD